MESERLDEQIQLVAQAQNRRTAAAEIFLIQAVSETSCQPLVSSHDSLQRLAQIMSCHSQQHGMRFIRALQPAFVPAGLHRHGRFEIWHYDTPFNLAARSRS